MASTGFPQLLAIDIDSRPRPPPISNEVQELIVRMATENRWRARKIQAERVVGSIRRELLDHVIVLNEDHLKRLLRGYVDYYNAERIHTSIGDTPVSRPVESRPAVGARVVGLPRVGSLHR